MTVENPIADVFKNGVLAAELGREPDGVTAFAYLPSYLENPGSTAVATTLPLTEKHRITQAGAVPPFFAGLLPEGRRLTGLKNKLKTSADDELSLLIAVGADTIGDVQIVPHGTQPVEPESPVAVTRSFDSVRFSDLLADAGIVDPVGIAGVQDKVSARMLSLPLRRRHERYILKLSPPEFPHVVENEAFFIALAKAAGLTAVDARIVADSEGRSGLLVTRFDRVEHEGATAKLAVEDACQALNLWPADKYNVTMEQAALAMISLCDARAIAAQHVFRQVAFAWLTGNGDLHAKNISALQMPDGEWTISPAYDLPSTALYNDMTLALSLNDEESGLSRNDLLAFAAAIGLPDRAAQRVLNRLLDDTASLSAFADNAELPFDTASMRSLENELAQRRVRLLP